MSFLVDKIDAMGLCPQRDSLETVTAAPRPTSVNELKSFLGLVSYYAKFLPSLTMTLAPLYQLLTKGAQWQWVEGQERVVQETSHVMNEADFLLHYDPRKQPRLECDASPDDLGAVLLHRINGRNVPISFRSMTLTSAELEKETLALVFGV